MVPQAGLAFRPVIEAPFAIRALLIGGISILAGGKAAPDFRILQLGTQVQRGLDQEPDPLAAGKWIIGIAIELTQRLARVVRQFGQCLGGAGDGATMAQFKMSGSICAICSRMNGNRAASLPPGAIASCMCLMFQLVILNCAMVASSPVAAGLLALPVVRPMG
jgi:hypothetical protein